MTKTQILEQKKKIVKVCVVLIFCTTVLGTMLAINDNRISLKESSFTNSNKSVSVSSTLTNSYKNK